MILLPSGIRRIASGLTLLLLCSHLVYGATLTYDADPATSGAQDGAGLGWNSNDSNWFDGSSDVQWPNTSVDVAVFGAGSGSAANVAVGTVTASQIIFNATGSGTYTLSSGTLTLAGGTPTIRTNANAAISSALAGSGGLTKAGTGTLTLSSAASTYSGGVIVAGGALQINSSAALRGAVSVNSDGTLFLNVNGATYSSSISGAGTVNATSPSATGNLIFTGNLSGFSGTLDVNGGGSSKCVYQPASSTPLLNSGATIKVHPGNTFFADLYQVTAANIRSSLYLYGAGSSENLGALRIEQAGATWSGPVTLLGNSSIGSYRSGVTATVSGTIAENGGSYSLTKLGAGTIALAAANTYSGTTNVGAGTLKPSHSLALQNSTIASGGIVFDSTVASHAFVFGGLSGSTSLPLQDSASNPVALTVGNNNTSTSYSGVIGGSGSLTKAGAGTLTLAGANTYTGPTTISAGTITAVGAPVMSSGLKIMPIGDSITFGYNGTNAGYRGPLYNLLSPVAPGLVYVGSSVQGNVTTTSSPLPADQRHNEGHGSYAIIDIYNNLDGLDSTIYNAYGGADRYPNGGHWFDGTTYTPYGGGSPVTRDAIYPDIITMMIGTNDNGSGPTTPAYNHDAVQTRLHNLLTKITTLRPSCKVFLAKITPRSSASNVNDYNTVVTSEAAILQAAGKLVYLVDLNTNFPSNGLYSDGVHPNDTGFNWMAQQWYNAIVSVCASRSGPSGSVPAASDVTMAAGATLDLAGAQVTAASLSGSGSVILGSGGRLVLGGTTSGTFSGIVSGDGSLTLSGMGTTTLAGVNSYTGATMVSSGTLKFSGSGSCPYSSGISVAAGAVLDPSGNSSALDCPVSLGAGNAGVNLQNASAGTWKANGGLTLNAGNVISVDVGNASDQIVVGGSYAGPASGTVTVNIAGLPGFASGTYPLISGASGISADRFAVGAAPSGHLYALIASNGTLSLVVDGVEAWRNTYFGTTANAGDAADDADPDGDGFNNAQEFICGSDPKDAASCLRIEQLQMSGNNVVVSFPTVTGKTYRLERSDTLSNNSWTTVLSEIAGTGDTVEVTEPGAAAQPKRFYRIIAH